MIKKNIKIELPAGLEARTVAVLVQVAGKFDSSIFIECGTKKVNSKSIMGMMALGIDNGDEVTILADGDDEEAAVAAVEEFLVVNE